MGRCPRSRLTVPWTLSPKAWLRQQPSPHLQFPPAPAVSGEQGFGRPLLASSSGAGPTTARVCSFQRPGRPLSQGVLPGEQAGATTSRPWTHWGTTASQVEAEETVACSPASTGLGFWAVEGRAVCAHGWTAPARGESMDGKGLTLAGAGSLLQKGREMAKSRIPATDAGRDAPGSLERRGDSKSTRVCKAMFSTSQKIVQLQRSI